jgi:hypothetical protein
MIMEPSFSSLYIRCCDVIYVIDLDKMARDMQDGSLIWFSFWWTFGIGYTSLPSTAIALKKSLHIGHKTARKVV